MNRILSMALAAPIALACGLGALPRAAEAAPGLATQPAQPLGAASAGARYDGVVEAVRQTVISAQVPGAVVALPVKAGDHVHAGQVLVRLDARAAEQQAGAAAAQVRAARASQEAATKEFERQRQLFQKGYISQAALDRAEEQFKSAEAQAAAQLAAAGAARTESGFYEVKAPYDGVVPEVAVTLGDMAMPGKPLLTLYDPSALRVTAALPESAARSLQAPAAGATSAPTAELPALGDLAVTPARWQALPAVDPSTHTVELRLDLPPGTRALPGMFARVRVPGGQETSRVAVPAQAVVRRAELSAVYVVGADGRPLLRQVRLGPVSGGLVEVLSGLAVGERVALDPQAAARVR